MAQPTVLMHGAGTEPDTVLAALDLQRQIQVLAEFRSVHRHPSLRPNSARI
ncbi:MAG TPA: hypothetical protein VGB91_17115 [Rhizomicrobium sp.]